MYVYGSSSISLFLPPFASLKFPLSNCVCLRVQLFLPSSPSVKAFKRSPCEAGYLFDMEEWFVCHPGQRELFYWQFLWIFHAADFWLRSLFSTKGVRKGGGVGGVGVKNPLLNLLCYKNVITYAKEFVYVFVHFLLVWCQLNAKATEWFCMKISRNTVNGPKRNNYILGGIWVIACIQKPSHHFLRTSRRLRIFMLVLRDSWLYS